ncbi:hypothetical protein ASZ90_017410 [hydrocarbon metagenome]|uniref:Uncharacterized protein n=1 Tax=hydrocarbon metagenome TaxID=938273 RepID=A0A0W8E9T6_9ZZZZ
MKILYNTVIAIETIQKLEQYIEKALAAAEPTRKQYINKAHITEQALNEYLDRVEKEV